MLKTCLYDEGVLNVKDLMRNGLANDAIAAQLITAIQHRAINGFEAERLRKEKICARKHGYHRRMIFMGPALHMHVTFIASLHLTTSLRAAKDGLCSSRRSINAAQFKSIISA